MSDTLTPAQRVRTGAEFCARVFNEHQPQLAREYATPDVVWHGGSLGTVSGVDGLTGLLTAFIGALPHLHADEQDVIASDALVVMRLVVSATHEADLLGIPATG